MPPASLYVLEAVCIPSTLYSSLACNSYERTMQPRPLFSWCIPPSECARIASAFHTVATCHHYARARGLIYHVVGRFWRGKILSCHSRPTWHDKVFHVENAVQRGRSYRASACGVTTLFGHANGTGATKKVRSAKFLGEINTKILNKKD